MPKLFFYLPNYPEWFTGGEKYHTIVLHYFLNTDGRNLAEAFGNEIPAGFYKINILRPFIGIWNISKLAKRGIIILTNSSFLDFILPLMLNRIWKKHIYFMIVHHLVRYDRPGFLRRKMEDYFIRHSHYIIAVSQTTKTSLVKYNLADDFVPVVTPGLDADKNFVIQDKHYGEKHKILYVGGLNERKGVIYLIKSLEYLTIKNFELNIIGPFMLDSDYFKRLRSAVSELSLEDKVFFRGKLSPDELRSYYLNSTLFVFPSLWEGYGMAAAEAMAYGLPVVGTKIPALEEIIDNGKEGILVTGGNAKEIGKAIDTLLNNVQLLRAMSNNSRIKSRSFPTWEVQAEKIIKIMYTFLSNHNIELK